ncbi:MAG TPA: hypothetical protein VEO54_26290 [Thermoanaerobaculia bacterium]|nr:hypothetical protein [Thermoanaerobaculia bacterium]
MRLSSVRDLKSSIAADPRWLTARSDEKANMAIGVALGGKPDEHRLAVRARSEEDVDPDLLAHLEKEAVGEVDLKYTGPRLVLPASDARPTRSLSIGASVAHYEHPAGTIGFFAVKGGEVGVVSNNHVLAAQNRGVDADEILHPAAADSGRSPNDVIGHLCGDYPRLRPEGQSVDCAFARLVPGLSFDPLALSPTERLRSTVAIAETQLLVEKIGRTTGRTQGIITAIELDFFDVDYRCGRLSFSGQIEIESRDAAPWCLPGDSGSLVFTRDCEPVGLLFLNTRAGGPGNWGRGYANPIGDVLSALGVTFAS